MRTRKIIIWVLITNFFGWGASLYSYVNNYHPLAAFICMTFITLIGAMAYLMASVEQKYFAMRYDDLVKELETHKRYNAEVKHIIDVIGQHEAAKLINADKKKKETDAT